MGKDRLGSRPTKEVVTPAKEELTSGIVNTKNQKATTPVGILNKTKIDTPTAASNQRTTALGNFQFSPDVTVKNTLSFIKAITSNAPCDFNIFITITIAPLDEGGATGKTFVMNQFHGIYENLWTADPTMVLYIYQGKKQHSSHVIPYERRCTRFPELRKFRKIASLTDLRRYTDQCNVYNSKCMYINLFLGHSIPMDQLMNKNVEYQVTNDQMQPMVKDVQAP